MPEFALIFTVHFVFQICKRKLKVLHSRSPLPSRTPKKGFEHKEFFQLQSIRRVLDFTETEDCRSAFGLIVKNAADKKETFLSFMIDSEDMEKKEFIIMLAKNIANTLCRADCVSMICQGICFCYLDVNLCQGDVLLLDHNFC